MTTSDQTFDFLALPDILVTSPSSKDTKTIPIHFVKTAQFEKLASKLSSFHQKQIENAGWTAQDSSFVTLIDENGDTESLYVGYEKSVGIFTICAATEKVKSGEYFLESTNLKPEDLENACIGWLLAHYRFNHFKQKKSEEKLLIIPKKLNTTRIESTARAAYLVRNLINLPPNALGPKTLANCVVTLAENFDAMYRITEDKELLEENLPLIYAVGDGSERRPCLAELAWGNPNHPHITLVGKGVCFDTGGYDIKPSSGMLLMKKDMGGAAMAMATALMIMSAKLPVYLRLLVPCVENSVSGHAYRPSDILTSRSGQTVEIGNTDAEGRLVLADCLTMACEESPDLLIDFATLTGAAHYAVGYDIGAVYSNNEKLGHDIQKLSLQLDDPLWNLPLWQNYKKDILSPIADINNSGAGNPAGSITAALFLQHFVTPETTWVHIDERAWQNAPQPGRSQGGKEMGVRTIFTLIEQRYAKKTVKKK
ncbi:MAG: leucyl aminopeptidase family protein [Alphaproteobacteria bacterium]|nr:leucyl aminopeptidase family protein [Alphaproteobacteria bacterium]